MNILLVGTAGHNLGDDALASVLAGRLQQIFPSASVTVVSVNRGRLASLGLNELWINRKSLKSWLDLLRKIWNSDIVLLGGGTLIQDALGVSLLRGMLPYIWQITFLVKLFGKPVATVPIGMDVLRHPRAMRMAEDILKRCDVVLLRDQRAFELARDSLGGSSSQLVLSADPVFAMNVPDVASMGEHDIPYLLISYVKEKREEQEVVRELSSLVEALHRKWPDHHLVLLSMDTRIEDELGIYRKVQLQLSVGRVDVESPSDYRKAARLIRGANGVVAMRLHAMIMALGHVPVVGISRTTKTDTLIAQSEMYGVSVQDAAPARVVELLDAAMNDEDKLKSQRLFVALAGQRFGASMDELARRVTGIEETRSR